MVERGPDLGKTQRCPRGANVTCGSEQPPDGALRRAHGSSNRRGGMFILDEQVVDPCMADDAVDRISIETRDPAPLSHTSAPSETNLAEICPEKHRRFDMPCQECLNG